MNKIEKINNLNIEQLYNDVSNLIENAIRKRI